jgi:hypothetical protein
VATIVSNLQTTVNADSVVTCTNQNTKLTCNANVAGTPFTYATSVITSFTSVFVSASANTGFDFNGVGFNIAF